MQKFICSVILALLPFSSFAAVEIGLEGRSPTRIDEVYLRDGACYLAIDDLLAAVGLSGRWDGVKHLYRINTRAGAATLAPGSRTLRLADTAIPLEHAPRFIDGRLRVGEELAAEHLGRLVGATVFYRNLDPGQGETGSKLPAQKPLAIPKP
jgi:N-acetylmuramoyl-L-alanine amidase